MKTDEKVFQAWLQEIELALPGLSSALQACPSEVMIIGAGVMGVYSRFGWIPPLKRSTGDLDISISLAQGETDYLPVQTTLRLSGYRQDDVHPYRHHSPKPLPNSLNYIDLLAQPGPRISATEAIRVMGAGEGFSFEGFDFAKKHAFRFRRSILLPNPFGYLALKRASYRDDPNRRVKDFADILELIFGLVEKGTHYDLKETWNQVAQEEAASTVLKMIQAIASDREVEWDVEDARRELLSRHFASDEIEPGMAFAAQELISAMGP